MNDFFKKFHSASCDYNSESSLHLLLQPQISSGLLWHKNEKLHQDDDDYYAYTKKYRLFSIVALQDCTSESGICSAILSSSHKPNFGFSFCKKGTRYKYFHPDCMVIRFTRVDPCLSKLNVKRFHRPQSSESQPQKGKSFQIGVHGCLFLRETQPSLCLAQAHTHFICKFTGHFMFSHT